MSIRGSEVNEKLVRKIEKLLNLGNGSNFVGEAEAALKMAYDLMQQNGISMEDVSKVSKDEVLGKLGTSVLDEEEKQYRKWEQSLIASIARLFDCQVVRTGYNSAYYKKATFSIVGREANRVTAKLMYDWIRSKTMKEARTICSTASSRNAYCTGVAAGIRKRVNETKAKEPKTDKWGLVPINEVSQYLRTAFGETKSRSLTASQVRDAAAYQYGKAEGGRISLNRQFGLKGIEAK